MPARPSGSSAPPPSPPAAAPAAGERAADLYLIDTMGYIFRAYHALPRLSNSRGTPTGAVLGFTNMLRKLLNEAQPPAIAAVFDSAGPTFRDEAYPQYKATRQAMPEDLGPQFAYIRRVLKAYRVPVLQYEGFEADDVIGTLARQAAETGKRVVIVSSDKDLLQLVNERVRVLIPTRGDLLAGPEEVEELLGVRPEQVADLLALRGDAVDNIPGAPGIGEKGARDLIQRFGSVQAALERAGEVERKTYRESLQGNRERIEQSRYLATIHANVPVRLDWDEVQRREPDEAACFALFQELEFTSLLKALGAPAAPASAAPAQAALPLATAQAAGAAAAGALLGAHRVVALAVSGEGIGLAADETCLSLTREAWPALAEALAARGRAWRVHDLKAVRRALAPLALPPLATAAVEDVELYSYLLDPTASSHALPALAQRWLGAAAPAGAGEAAAAIAALARRLAPELEAAGLRRCYDELDLPLVPVLEAMEDAGVLLDPEALAELTRELDSSGAALERRIFALAGVEFNLNSPKQLGEILFEKMGLPQPPRRGKSKSLSTAVDVLEQLADQFDVARLVLDYRQVAKLKSTYAEALPRFADASGRLHTTFTQVGTATGRLASSNPNLQNIPIRSELGRRIRAAFRAAPGHLLVAADYSQIELRLLAHFSQDPHLLAAFRRGDDIHALTAAEVFGVPFAEVAPEHRRRAKAINFGIVYGLSAFGLARQLGIPQAEAARFIARYFERYAGVRGFIDRTLAQARQDGAVRTLFGRRRPIPDIASRNATLRGFAERTAVNTPLQGTAADLMRLAMIRVAERLRREASAARLLLQVHDELVLEAPLAQAGEVAAWVRDEMEHVTALDVPLTVDIGVGPNWRDLEDLPQ